MRDILENQSQLDLSKSDVSALDSFVLSACERTGVDLIEMDFFSAGKRKILRIFIDKDGGVDVEDCASVSRILSFELDKEENASVIKEAYTIEVSSPGLDRPLKTKRDFERNLGRTLRIVLNSNKIIKGILKSVKEHSLIIETGKKAIKKEELEVSLDKVLTVKVEP